MLFSFVCVNYNNSPFTEKFIKSLEDQVEIAGEVQIIVVDNDSSQEDKLELRRICLGKKNIDLIFSEDNLGYFGGLNLGLEHVKSSDYVIVGNNDLEFESEFCSRLVAAHYPDDVLVVAPDVITPDGYNQNPHCRRRVGRIKKFLYQLYFSSYYCARMLTFASALCNKIAGGRSKAADQVPGYIHMGIGAVYILLPKFFQYFERLDDRVFLYGEEALLAGQLAHVEGKTFYDPSLKVMHAESASTSKMPSKGKYEITKKSFQLYKEYL